MTHVPVSSDETSGGMLGALPAWWGYPSLVSDPAAISLSGVFARVIIYIRDKWTPTLNEWTSIEVVETSHIRYHCRNLIKVVIKTRRQKRPRHQTEIVNGAHLGAGARIAYTRAMCWVVDLYIKAYHSVTSRLASSIYPDYFSTTSATTRRSRHVTGRIRVNVTQLSTPASMEHRVAIWSFSSA